MLDEIHTKAIPFSDRHDKSLHKNLRAALVIAGRSPFFGNLWLGTYAVASAS